MIDGYNYDVISPQMMEIMALPGRFGAWVSKRSRGSAFQWSRWASATILGDSPVLCKRTCASGGHQLENLPLKRSVVGRVSDIEDTEQFIEQSIFKDCYDWLIWGLVGKI